MIGQNMQKKEKEVQSVMDVTESAEGGEGGLMSHGCDRLFTNRTNGTFSIYVRSST